MKVVIPGGSGFIGRMLAAWMADRGHEVVILTRTPRLTDAGWREVEWDGRTLGGWANEIDGADVVINLTGRSVNCRYNEANKAEIYASRLDSTHVIGEAISASSKPPKVWLNSSSATIYRHAEDRDMDEATGEIGKGFSVDVCQKWEEAFFEAPCPGVRKVALRSAMVMAPDKGGPFEAYAALAKVGLGGKMGSGHQYVSWIHHRDFCRACEFLIEHSELDGVVNLAAPGPVPNAAFMAAVRHAVGARFGLPLPQWALKVGAWAKGTEIELIVKSRRVVPGRLLVAGFDFEFTEWGQAADDLG